MDNILNGNVPVNLTSASKYGSFGSYNADGSAYRGLFSDWINQENIAKEDFMRAEQSADNALSRDLYLQEQQNSWQSAENDKAYQRTLEMDATKYQRAVEDMKKSGINPIMLMGHGVDSPISPNASASTARSSGANYRGGGSSDSTGVLSSIANGLLHVLAGLVTKGNTYNYTINAGKKK